MASREALFGSRELSLMVRTFADNSRNEFCTDLFRKGNQTDTWDPNYHSFDIRKFGEELAPAVGRNDEPPTTKMPDESNKVVSLAKFAHVISIPGDRLFREREVGQLQPNAPSVVSDVVMQGMNKLRRSVELLCALALLDNYTVNSTVIPGSKTSFTFSWGCDTINAATWSTISTLIVSQKIKAMCDQFRQNSGMLPGLGIMNSKTEGYLLENTELQTLISHFPAVDAITQADHRGTAVLNGLGIGQMEWRKHVGGYKGDGTTWTDFIPNDKVVLLPPEDQLKGVIGICEGYNLVPAKLWGNGSDAAEQMMLAPTKGFSVYSELKTRPMRVDLVFEWIGTPVIYHPKAVQVASV